jgi:hypothetical protein
MSMKENLDAMNTAGNKGFERLNALGDLNLRIWEKMAVRQLDAMSLFMEQGMRHVKLAAESKGYSDFLKGETELAKEISNRLMEETKVNMQLAGQVRDEYRNWFQDGLTELSSEMRKAAPSA